MKKTPDRCVFHITMAIIVFISRTINECGFASGMYNSKQTWLSSYIGNECHAYHKATQCLFRICDWRGMAAAIAVLALVILKSLYVMGLEGKSQQNSGVI